MQILIYGLQVKRTLHCPGRETPLASYPSLGENPFLPDCQNILMGHELTVSFFGLQPYIVFGPGGHYTGGDLETIRVIAGKMAFKPNFKVYHMKTILAHIGGNQWGFTQDPSPLS